MKSCRKERTEDRTSWHISKERIDARVRSMSQAMAREEEEENQGSIGVTRAKFKKKRVVRRGAGHLLSRETK